MAVTDPAVVADTADEKRHIFPFFDLPQELRDEIYDLSLIDYTAELKCGLNLKATEVPATDLLLVSKAFGAEYQLRAKKKKKKKKKSHVLISDTREWEGDGDITRLPAPVARAHTVHINLVCDQEDEVDQHGYWLLHFADSAQRPPELSIRVNYTNENVWLETLAPRSRDWATCKGLKELKVYERIDGKGEWDFETEDRLYWAWSSSTGKFRDVGERPEHDFIVFGEEWT